MKRRTQKEDRKQYKAAVSKGGHDPDAYLQDAFIWKNKIKKNINYVESGWVGKNIPTNTVLIKKLT